MTPAVERAVPKPISKATDILVALNKEWLPLVGQLRASVNALAWRSAKLTTAGVNAPETLWSEPMPRTGVWLVEARVSAVHGGMTPLGLGGAWRVTCGFISQAGAPTALAASVSDAWTNIGGASVAIAVSSSEVAVTITDGGVALVVYAAIAVIEVFVA